MTPTMKAGRTAEVRYNHNHDPENGQFTSASGVSKRYSNGGAKTVDKSTESGIIGNNKGFSHPQLKLPKKEYGKIIREIDDAYHVRYADKQIGVIQDREYKAQYFFEIRGYNDYNIFMKTGD